MMFRVGQKVVCVHGTFGADDWKNVLNRPITGLVYTVRALTVYSFVIHPDTPCILLEEIRNPVETWDDGSTLECPFWIGRFRPIVERKTDISFAHEILRKVARKRRVSA